MRQLNRPNRPNRSRDQSSKIVYIAFVLLACLGMTTIVAVFSLIGVSMPFLRSNKETSYLQLLATTERWTQVNKVGIDCVGGICTREIYLSMTLLTPELIEDMVRYDLAESSFDENQLQAEIDALKQRLGADEQLIFLLTVIPDDYPDWIRATISLGNVSESFRLSTTKTQGVFLPNQWDAVFNTPISLESLLITKGFIFFDYRQRTGIIPNFQEQRSINIQLRVNDDWNSDRTEVAWQFDFINAYRPPPLKPTPTLDPNITPEPIIDSDGIDTIIAIIELTDFLINLAESK